MTTAARTVNAPIAKAPAAAKAAPTAPEETHAGAWLLTALVATFFATIAIVFWMAHTVHV